MSRTGRNQPDLSVLSDEELLDRYRAGNTQAFGVLVHRYERELYNYLRRYLGDATLAEDVFQNTFLQLHVKLDLYEKGRLVRPWLYTIATHQAIDALRKAGRHRTVSLDAQAPSQNEQANTFAELLEGPATDPLEGLEAAERRQWVRDTLDRLPEYMKSVVVLVYYQGLKYREVADVLDIPVGTVKSRLHAAIAKLAEEWRQVQEVVEHDAS
jgi:RNA polymerase sigma-70 factor (ECF subfamily)